MRPLVLSVLVMTAAAAPRIQVHGHRGARAVLPENSIPAFEHAIEAGADVVELDLAVTRDNVLVASHDPVLPPEFRGPAGATRVIREMTFAQLRQWECAAAHPKFPKQRAVPGTRVPSLDEVLALASRGSFHFNIETKIFPDRPHLTPGADEFARLLVEAVRARGLASRVIIQSFDFRTLRAAARLAPEIRRSALFEGRARDIVRPTLEIPASITSPAHAMLNPDHVAAARAAKLEIVPWTANTPAEWDRLIRLGVDAIITDDPAALIAHLRARGLR